MHIFRLQALEHQQYTMLQTSLNALNSILNLKIKHDKINLKSKSMLEQSELIYGSSNDSKYNKMLSKENFNLSTNEPKTERKYCFCCKALDYS